MTVRIHPKKLLKFESNSKEIIDYTLLSNFTSIGIYVGRRTVNTGDSFNPPCTSEDNMIDAQAINI